MRGAPRLINVALVCFGEFPTSFQDADYPRNPRCDAASGVCCQCASLLYFMTGLLTS